MPRQPYWCDHLEIGVVWVRVKFGLESMIRVRIWGKCIGLGLHNIETNAHMHTHNHMYENTHQLN